METYSSSDKRLFQRVPLRISLRFLNTSTNKWNLVQTEDISARGIGMLTQREVDPETPLEMWLPIPERGETYYTRGKVAWSRRLEPDRYRVGVELNRVDLMGLAPFMRKAEAAV
ncbi:MAG: PilZ domain-containing protein [Candidatus Omnitrophota bacterium]